MKFTLEEGYNGIVAKIKEKEANPLLNERGIKDLLQDDIDFMTEHNIEVELETYIEKKLKKFQSIDGNIRKVNSTTINKAIEDALNDYKAKNTPLKKKVQKKGDDDPIKDDEALEALRVELSEQIKSLQDKNSAYELEKSIQNKRGLILAKFKEKGIEDKDWIESIFDIAEVKDNTDVDAYVEKGLKLNNSDTMPLNKTPKKTSTAKLSNSLIDATKAMVGKV